MATLNPFRNLDEIDLEAERQGRAISDMGKALGRIGSGPKRQSQANKMGLASVRRKDKVANWGRAIA